MITAISSQVWIEKDLRLRYPAARAGKLYSVEVREGYLSVSAGLLEGAPRPVLAEWFSSAATVITANMAAVLRQFNAPPESYISSGPSVSSGVLNTVSVIMSAPPESYISSSAFINNGDMQIRLIRYTRGAAEKYSSGAANISGGTMNAG